MAEARDGEQAQDDFRLVNLMPGRLEAACNRCGRHLYGFVAGDLLVYMTAHTLTHNGGPT